MTTGKKTLPIFSRSDWLCGLGAALVAWAVYFWTAAPNVTLLDSGEFIVAAQQFGVPHPTGYPLWTLLAWLFHLLPIGNAAWEINLFSGLIGGLAVGLAAMLIRSTCEWLLPDGDAFQSVLASIAAFAMALTFAFSLSMWSQAVIAEVYTLHALLIGFYLTSLYVWLRRPGSDAPLYWTFFTLTLAFSNHHLSLALAPLPFVIAVLARRAVFVDLCLAVLLSALMAYLAFALLAEDPLILKAAIRLAWLTGAIFLVAFLVKRSRMHLRLIVFVPMAIALGMLPYAYLPIASHTNPPMNWGYTRTVEGFFASFNRSQYQGPLTDQSLRVLGTVLGMGQAAKAASADGAESADERAPRRSLIEDAFRWVQFFWQQLILSFSPVAVILFFAVLLPVLRCPLDRRVWYYVLLFGFSLAAFLQPVIDRATTDNGGWWLQMPYHTYTNLIFAILCGIGGFLILTWLRKRSRRLLPVGAGLILAIPAWPLIFCSDAASQRGRWFGWEFGHEMLKDLPEGAVVFGGTDPGRFVPTYMIFGESPQPGRVKRDPDFDRRDLYIITQNAAADPLYLSYIRDHYGKNRPNVSNAFEKWLGRSAMYPAKPLRIPSRSVVSELLTKKSEELTAIDAPEFDRRELSRMSHSELAKWIFNENKGDHRFFVEESFPMDWSYPYAIPSGMLYEIHPEPLDKIPDAAVISDMNFWKSMTRRLLEHPDFKNDYDAQRSFSKLRLTAARIYRYRKMTTEAIQAGRESLALWPSSLETVQFLNSELWKSGEFDEPVRIAEAAFFLDPNSEMAARLFVEASDRRATEPEILSALERFRAEPGRYSRFQSAANLLGKIGDADRLNELISSAEPTLGKQDDFLSATIDIALQLRDWKSARDRAETRAKTFEKADLWLDLAAIEGMRGATPGAINAVQKAVTIDRDRTLERVRKDPSLGFLEGSDEAEKILFPGGTDQPGDSQ